jgi:hypothetical protein
MTRCASQLALLLLFPARWLAYVNEEPRGHCQAALYVSCENLSQGHGSALP